MADTERNAFVSRVTGLSARAYRGPVAGIARRLHINDLYWTAMTRIVGDEYTHEIDGVSAILRTDSTSETRQVVNLSNERSVVYDVLDELRPDDVFHDVGANIGVYTLLAADIIGNKNTVAVEPHPPTADRLRDNAARSGVDPHVLELALSTSAGEGFLSVPTDEAGVLFGRIDASGRVPVRLERGDTLVNRGEVPGPTVIKADVEGTEVDVLRSYGNYLQDVRTVYVETHRNGDKLRTLLYDRGFSVDTIHERDSQEYLKATRDDHST